MHPTRTTRLPLFLGAILFAGLSAAGVRGQVPQPPPTPKPVAPPQPNTTDVMVDKNGVIHVMLGATALWSPDLPDIPVDFTVSNESIVGLKVDQMLPKKFALKGQAPGQAQITFYFKGSPKIVFEVIVEPDLNLLRSIVKTAVPNAAVTLQPGIGSTLIISGYVTSPQDADTLTRLAANFAGSPNAVINAVQVGGVQQVQIDVVVASVDRTMARTRGLDFSVGGSTVNFQSIVSGLLTNAIGTGVTPTINNTANLQLAVVPSQFFLALQALRTEGIAKFLAEPKVVTQTGRPAFFRAGGQQAILSGTSGITGPGVQLVPFGTELEVLPIVYGNGMIWLEINPKVTAVSQALGITVGGAVSPGFTEQQVRAAVLLESGQTFAIGGLIQNSIQASSSKVPVLGDLPFVGVAFSTVTHTQTDSELVIMVTPRLVGPMNCDQVPKRLPGRESRNPDDYELFLENILEAPRGQRKVWNGRCYNAAYKSDPTSAIFPCVGGNCGAPGRPVGPTVGGSFPLAPTAAGAATVPAQLPSVPQQLPSAGGASAMPVVPGSPVDGSGLAVEPQPMPVPVSLPPVVVLPEAPRN